LKRGLIEALSQSGHSAAGNAEFNEFIYQKAVIKQACGGMAGNCYIVVSMGILIHLLQKS